MSKEAAEAFPLHWPIGWPRTKQRAASRFSGTFGAVRSALVNEIAMMGGQHVVISTNVPLRRDGLPIAARTATQDPGVAVYFERRGRQMCFACDRWMSVRDNMRAIEKTINAIRGIERWGASEMMERAFQAFEALPPPRSCWDVLGLRPGASREDVERAYRERAKRAHPDAGGSHAAMAELNTARDAALAN